MKTKEELIHEEMQSLRAVGFKLVQWGIAVLVLIELTLAFIRRIGFDSMAAKQPLGVPLLPFERHLLGTILILAVAAIFAILTTIVSRRFRFYSNLIRNDNESIVPVPVDADGRLLIAMFAVFPVLDLLLWPYLRIVSGT
jgi:hypothetical protein